MLKVHRKPRTKREKEEKETPSDLVYHGWRLGSQVGHLHGLRPSCRRVRWWRAAVRTGICKIIPNHEVRVENRWKERGTLGI